MKRRYPVNPTNSPADISMIFWRSAIAPIGFQTAALLEKSAPCEIAMNSSERKVITGRDIMMPAIFGDFFSAIMVMEVIKILPDIK